MSNTISFHVDAGQEVLQAQRLVLCIGRAADIRQSPVQRALRAWLPEAPDASFATLDECVEAFQDGAPSKTASKGKSVSVLFPSCPTQNRKLVKVVVHTIAASCSRHNSSGRPDDITVCVENAVSSDMSSNGVRLLICVRDANEAFAAGCAVARALPLYSRKSSAPDWSSKQRRVQVHFLFDNAASPISSERLVVLHHAAEGVQRAAALVDMPTAELDTDEFVVKAQAVERRLKALGHPVSLELIQGEDLRDRGFGGLWGVGKAAERPPALVVLKFEPDSATTSITWAGKGIVYDTGGLSIKGKSAMPGMKRDMGGAAAVLCAFEAAVASGFRQRLNALLCLAENAVGPKSTRPDDILHMYSQKTVEINNTDAEGRLVLGDGVAFASRHLKTDVIVDLATLTGAQGVATGAKHAAIYCDNEELELSCVKAGRACGDLVHPLPFCPEFFAQEFKSSVADMKNSVACRSNAQSSCAGEFIRSHLHAEYEGKWLHIDLAYPSFRKERATGFGVALLLQMFHPLLQ